MKRAICVVMVCAMLLGNVPANAATFGEDAANVAYDTIVGAIIGGIANAFIGMTPPEADSNYATEPHPLWGMLRDGIIVGGMLGFLNGLSKTE